MKRIALGFRLGVAVTVALTTGAVGVPASATGAVSSAAASSAATRWLQPTRTITPADRKSVV